MKLSIIGLIVLGMVAAFCAALLMAAVGKTPVISRDRANEPVKVLVASSDMPSMTVLDNESFRVETMLAREAPAGAVSNPAQVVGKPLTRKVLAGQALTGDCFATNYRGVQLVSSLPPGKRAVTVELTLAAGLEGLLYPGSTVDVVASFELDSQEMRGMAVSTTLLQDVQVLAIDDVTNSEEDAKIKKTDNQPTTSLRLKSRRVTMLVDARQAEALQLASEHGTVSLAMRNPLDKTQTDQDATLLNQGRLAGLAEYLDTWVGSSRQPGSASAAQSSAESPSVASVGPAGSSRDREFRWDVTVLRGSQIEVRSFELNSAAGSPLAADHQP